ncbi:hypothetical protein A374_06641 [Fictibacillus macauensis ZFHKF-1]|uniref:Uncharacterized protein n=1 Tax=Fictibacillus macauensis ZFHKF-1 TaxID=1196324 RepID=I8J3B6_9BACL|nr:PD-(D/E)XK nuclease family protein [Fictibacillus macauensis]EIT86256.1 hypothetical protein A374_06641 [Fictibacillus macauensis ZFHKF-1]
MASIFSRLLQLYKVKNKTGKTPLEDFITEVLAGILQSNQQLLDSFVNDVLHIEGSNFKVESQVPFTLECDKNCIIDLVFENETTICFLENKVASDEGERQLERYAAVLIKLAKLKFKDTHLRYCTKRYDPKTVSSCSFKQFRWQQIYEFLYKQEETEVINNFLQLLRSEKMAGIKDFQIEDVLVMKGLQAVMSKMDEMLELVLPDFTKNFGVPHQRGYGHLKQLPLHNQYCMLTTNYNESFIEVKVGFEMESVTDHPSPILFVQVHCDKDINFAQKMKSHSEGEDTKFDFYQIENEEVYAWFEETLLNFLASSRQKEEIIEWFARKMGVTKRIIDQVYDKIH